MRRTAITRAWLILCMLWLAAGAWPSAQATPAQDRRGRDDRPRSARKPATPKVPVAWVPHAGDTALMFIGVKPAQTAQFEATMVAVKQVLAASTNPIRQKQRASWRVYRPVEMYNGAFLYLFLLAPPMPGADYSVASILAEGLPEDRKILATYLGSLSGQQSLLTCTTVLQMAPSTDGLAAVELPAPDPSAPAETPPPDARTFSGDLGLMMMDIRPDVQADFVATLTRLRDVMAVSKDAKLRHLGKGWRLLGPAPVAAAPSAPGAPPAAGAQGVEAETVPMLFLMDPPVPGADYSVSKLLSNAFPAETGLLFRTYRGAFEQGVVRLNYTLVNDFSQ